MKILLLFLLFFKFDNLKAAVFGSDAAVSAQQEAFFPNDESDNAMQGFVAFDKGFRLEDITTSCTFDALFPIEKSAILAGGNLYLEKDMQFLSNAELVTGGIVCSQKKALIFPKSPTQQKIPCSNPLIGFQTLDSLTTSSVVQSVDFNYDGSYIASGGGVFSSSTEVQLYYFDGTTLTTTLQQDFPETIRSVRWHPTLNYLAVCHNSYTPAPGFDIYIYFYNVSNGTFTQTDGQFLTGTGFSLDWHPSGNYLINGSDKTTEEIRLYSFDSSNGTIAEIDSINLSPNRAVAQHATSFAPGGNFFAVGTERPSATDTLFVYSFDGSSIALDSSLDLGIAVSALDWSPSGTYLAVGLDSGSERLRVYKHSEASSTLTEAVTARVEQANTVLGVHWDSTGKFLTVGDSAGSASTFKVYYFDKETERLKLIGGSGISQDVNEARWSRDDRYIVRGDNDLSVTVSARLGIILQFDQSVLEFNATVIPQGTWKFNDTCRIVGNGHTFDLGSVDQLLVRPDSNLILENLKIVNLEQSIIAGMTDESSITFKNCVLILSNDYTFSIGSILFDCDNVISGSTNFVFSSAITSTIAENSTLMIDQGVTFEYNPEAASKNLLYFENENSTLFLDSSTLMTSQTGLNIYRGNIIIDNKVSFSNEANYFAEGFEISDDVNVQVLSGGELNIHGYLRFIE